MGVIAELRFSPTCFDLGRALDAHGRGRIELERLVPLGEDVAPFVWVHEASNGSFERRVREHPTVAGFTRREVRNGRTLYELDWDPADDDLFAALADSDASLLRATGGEEGWYFEVRFPDREALGDFQRTLSAVGITFEIEAIYDPSRGSSWDATGVTDPQREALVLAAERGYFAVPRKATTKDLGAELGISDQAVTERLRRGIATLVENAFRADPDLPTEESDR